MLVWLPVRVGTTGSPLTTLAWFATLAVLYVSALPYLNVQVVSLTPPKTIQSTTTLTTRPLFAIPPVPTVSTHSTAVLLASYAT